MTVLLYHKIINTARLQKQQKARCLIGTALCCSYKTYLSCNLFSDKFNKLNHPADK